MQWENFLSVVRHLSFLDTDRGGFGEILPEVINIITEGNNSPTPRAEGL